MPRIIFLFTACFVIGLYATADIEAGTNSPVFDWQATFGGDYADSAYAVSRTSDGGYVAAGLGSQNYFQQVYVVKTDEAGTLEWERSFNLSNYSEIAYHVEETQDGGYLVVASAYISALAENRPWLIKLDANGNLVWSTENGLTQTIGVDSAVIVGAERVDGTFVIAGGSNTFTNVQDPWFALVSATGELLSFQPLEPLATGYGEGTYVNDLIVTQDGGFALAGIASPPFSGLAFLWKFDATAQEEWVELYDDDGLGSIGGVIETADSGFALAGCDFYCDRGAALKTDAQGQTEWVFISPDVNYTQGKDIVQQGDGTYLFSQIRFTAFGASDYASELVALDADGNYLATTPVPGGDYATVINRLQVTADSAGFVAAGYANDTNDPDGSDLFLLRGSFVGQENQPPAALPDSYTVEEGAVLWVDAPGVLGNDSDADGDELTAVLGDIPQHGAFSFAGNGAFVYTPTVGYVGNDTFTYQAYDGIAFSDTTVVTLTVNEAANHPPVAVDDFYQATHESLFVADAMGVLQNDSDIDGDELTAVLITPPQQGTLTLQADGTFTYTPLEGFTGEDSFTYQATDGQHSSETAVVTITSPVAPPPTYTLFLPLIR